MHQFLPYTIFALYNFCPIQFLPYTIIYKPFFAKFNFFIWYSFFHSTIEKLYYYSLYFSIPSRFPSVFLFLCTFLTPSTSSFFQTGIWHGFCSYTFNTLWIWFENSVVVIKNSVFRHVFESWKHRLSLINGRSYPRLVIERKRSWCIELSRKRLFSFSHWYCWFFCHKIFTIAVSQ